MNLMFPWWKFDIVVCYRFIIYTSSAQTILTAVYDVHITLSWKKRNGFKFALSLANLQQFFARFSLQCT